MDNKKFEKTSTVIVTAGSNYLDIDAYACCVAMAQLLQRKGKRAIAFSAAPCNYSVCASLFEKTHLLTKLPPELSAENSDYVIVDVSDPEFIKDSVPIDRVKEIYDHHVGFEEYWENKIGNGTHIEFIGAAATLVYREWKRAGMQDQLPRETALLLIAAILDNTLNLTSSNTTAEDRAVFDELCKKEQITKEWCAAYFSAVQQRVEEDLKNALFGDIKSIRDNEVLPSKMAQLCVWNAQSILEKLPQIRAWFAEKKDTWMVNIIDLSQRCSYFVCDDGIHQQKIEKVFEVRFESGVAKTPIAYLRKEIIKKTILRS